MDGQSLETEQNFKCFEQVDIVGVGGVSESEKDGEPRNQVPEEGFETEEGWDEIFNILVNFFIIDNLGLNFAR